MDNKRAKNLLKIAVALYLASFFVINWNDVSWIFNYKEVYGLIDDFFNPYPSIEASSMEPYFYPNHSGSEVKNVIKEVRTNYTDKQNTLEIPALSLEAPIIFADSADKNDLMEDLDKGTVYYPGSVYPGQNGQIVIMGHSAPEGWPKVKYDWVFSKVEDLKEGDQIFIDLNNKQYTYIVRKTTIIKKGADVPTDLLTGENNVLTLISCWPPGKDYQRIAVQAELRP